jgi:hypothetical protein
MGTNSFTGGSDGLMIMTYYELNQTTNDVYGAEILLTTSTVPGGNIILHVLDTADVFDGTGVVDNPVVSSVEVTITQEMVDDGFVRIYFDGSEPLEEGAYYLSAELFSIDNEFDIRILDDVTVPQPGNGTLIYIPDVQVYGNGNASAVRLLTTGPNAINEIEKTAVLAQNVPNPASDYTTISFELLDNQKVTVRLTDITGKVVMEENLGNLTPGNYKHTFELSGLNAGTYHYSIITNNGILSKSMQVIR